MGFTKTKKRYQLGKSAYEFVSRSNTYREFKTDKDGNIIRRLNKEVYENKPITAELVTELFDNPNMYLANTAPKVGRSLTVMETIGEDVVFRGFVACKDYSIQLTTDKHAEDVLDCAKECVKETDLP